MAFEAHAKEGITEEDLEGDFVRGIEKRQQCGLRRDAQMIKGKSGLP